MISFGRVADNILTILIVFGFGYLIYLKMRGKKMQSFKIGKLFGRGKNDK
jgi:hypothetical protein